MYLMLFKDFVEHRLSSLNRVYDIRRSYLNSITRNTTYLGVNQSIQRLQIFSFI